MRPEALHALVSSIQKFYFDNQILIVNDGDKPLNYDAENIHCINTDFDIGVSAGRNLAVQNVKTPYFVLLDDDFEFSEQTNIKEFCRVQQKTNADIVIGAVDNVCFGKFVFDDDVLRRKKVTCNNQGFCQVDCGPNFFFAKTEAVKRVLWDENMRMMEHWDFFLRCKENGLRVFYTNRVKIKHNHDKFQPVEYKRYKQANKKVSRYVPFKKHNITTNAFWR